ncbi:MAG: tail fiber domain-containing protein [Pyrinomonadaceae bacterium]
MKYTLYILLILLFAFQISAQTTEFTYQGQLQSSSVIANGNFDFEFALFDSQSGGSQVGSTLTRNGVGVANGIFSVNLDFGNGFPGASRFLEIRVRQAGGGAFTTLSPRQPISSAPYAVKSITSDSATVAVNAITANNATNAQNAVNAQTAVNFSGSIAGDVTGTQGSTIVGRLQNRTVSPTAPTSGQVLKYNGTQWEPGTDSTGAGGGGTITGVTAGTGLTGGGTTGTVAVAIANSGVTTTQLADASVTDPKIVSVSGAKVTGAVTDSNQLGGVAANQFVVTTDPRMTNDRPPTAGSANYIQNGGAVQASSNFNISGNGTANVFNASTQFNIGGGRILSSPAGSFNLFVGFLTGQATTTGTQNSFFGYAAGQNTTTGGNNAFFGGGAGFANTTGNLNAFFGSIAGSNNTTGIGNSFFGGQAGLGNTTGAGNAFFGSQAGQLNTTASHNSFFGELAGFSNTTGSDNAFFGARTGSANTVGPGNSFFGTDAGKANTSGESNTFVGVFSGDANTVGDGNAFFGRDAGGTNTTGGGNAFFGRNAGNGNTTGGNNTIIGNNADVGSGNLTFATAIGAGADVSNSNSVVLGRNVDTVRIPGSLRVTGGTDAEPTSGGYIILGSSTLFPNVVIDDNEIMARDGGGTATLFLNADGGDVNLISTGTGNVGIGISSTAADKLHVDGIIRVSTLGAGGATSLCRNGSQQISTCSSSLRYKNNINRFGLGLDLINRLKPITFDWKGGGMHDLGLGAEDVAAIEPLLVTYNTKGEVEGVKYDRIGVVLVNAVKEQQRQIATQNGQIEALLAANAAMSRRLRAVEKRLAKKR